MLHVIEPFIVHPRLNVFNILCICFQLNSTNLVSWKFLVKNQIIVIIYILLMCEKYYCFVINVLLYYIFINVTIVQN